MIISGIGGGYSDPFRQLLTSESATKEQIAAYKEEETFRIIDYAYRHCPFYHSSFQSRGLTPSDFKCMDDLQKFPILTKEDVRRYWMGMLSDEADRQTLISRHTSGSTGKALDFFLSRENLQFYWATVWRGRARADIHKGDLHLNFTGKLVIPLQQSRPPYWRYNRALNQYMLNMQHINTEKTPYIVRFINDVRPKFLVGYPSIIHSFTSFVEELGLKVEHMPLCMFPAAEKLYDFQREQILHVFPDMKIMEHYGFSENVASASKCAVGHYHEDWELGHLELQNPEANEKGLTGTLLATGFKNTAMPFIRYDVGDTATFSTTDCQCGLHSRVITDIEGRKEDYILTPEGTRIKRFDYLFKATRTVKECQIVQRKPGEIIIRIVRRADYKQSDEKNIENLVHSMISPGMRVTFDYVSEIPRTKAGKFRAVISELKQ